jgi:hypothetical protein
LFRDLLPPTEAELQQAEADLAEWLSPEAKEIWRSAEATSAAAEVIEDADGGEEPDIYAEELEYDMELHALESMSEHEAAEGDIRHDGEAIPVEMRAQFIETATGRHIPIGRNKNVFKINAILDDRSSKNGRQYLVRWAGLRQPTWENGVNLSPTAVEAYGAGKHGKKVAKAIAAQGKRDELQKRKLARAIATEERRSQQERRRKEKEQRQLEREEGRRRKLAEQDQRRKQRSRDRKRKESSGGRRSEKSSRQSKRTKIDRAGKETAAASGRGREATPIQHVASTSRAGRKRRPAWKLRVQDEDAIVASAMAESMDSLLNGDTEGVIVV